MRSLVSLTDNCGTNPSWSDWSWSTDNSAPGLLSVSFLMEPDFFPFVIRCLLLVAPNIHYLQRVTSSLKSRNIDGRTPIFSSLKMDLGWRWDNLSWQDLNSFCKVYITYVKMMFSIFYCVLFFDSFIYLSGVIVIDPISGTFLY